MAFSVVLVIVLPFLLCRLVLAQVRPPRVRTAVTRRTYVELRCAAGNFIRLNRTCARWPQRRAWRPGGEHLVKGFVHVLVRDVPFGVRVLEALHGRVAVVVADQ
jgi:hypothetical protein